MADYSKINDTTLGVAESIEIVQEAKSYTLDQLKMWEAALVKKAADITKTIDAELIIVRALIAKCIELGIKEAADVVVEPVIPESK